MTGMPELTTLCYLVKDGKALMLHRVVKKNDVNKDKWMLNGIVTFDSAKQDHTEYMFLYTVTEWTGTAHECDEGVLEWIDFDRIRNMNLWEGDRIFLKLLDEGHPFFSLKLVYDEKDVLRGAVLDGRQMELFDILNPDGTLAGYTRERSIAHEMGSLHGTVHGLPGIRRKKTKEIKRITKLRRQQGQAGSFSFRNVQRTKTHIPDAWISHRPAI